MAQKLLARGRPADSKWAIHQTSTAHCVSTAAPVYPEMLVTHLL
ncbi:unnamed protein product [Ectocarpus sp. CCAP 1310/34]|nr:unnamed protein product [Ectocarpus sp. CCAP 1310/34]